MFHLKSLQNFSCNFIYKYTTKVFFNYFCKFKEKNASGLVVQLFSQNSSEEMLGVAQFFSDGITHVLMDKLRNW